jgi:nitrogenase subunit NifH
MNRAEKYNYKNRILKGIEKFKNTYKRNVNDVIVNSHKKLSEGRKK